MEKLKLWFFNNRHIIVIISIIVIGIFLYFNFQKEDEVIEEKEEIEEVSVVDEVNDYIYVDIKGEVKNKGVYKIFNGARVIDAINVAGGLLDTSDTTLLNLSMKLHDEMSITIYSREEVKNFVKLKEEVNEKINECNKTNEICIEAFDDINNGLININKASLEELMSLPKIGETKAKSIIEYRTNNGLFKSIDEIVNVSGIGDSLFEQIKDYITV